MIIKQLIDEDFINYKKPCMVLGFPYCTFKCDKECGQPVCQNSELATAPNINMDISKIIERYINNPITEAICFQGLEPLDSFKDVVNFIHEFRYTYNCNDDIVIYTGYTEEECESKFQISSWGYSNIIIKYGRFIPDQNPHYDEVLGVELASDNQYAKKYNTTE